MFLWKKNISKPAGLESITISSKRQGPPGKDIDIRIIPNNINNDITYTKLVANEVKSLLSKYEGVSDIYDDLPWGKEELVLRLLPLGKSLRLLSPDFERERSLD